MNNAINHSRNNTKRFTVLGLVLVLLCWQGSVGLLLAQQTSSFSSADSLYFRRLEYVCKVWGYVKYFHPNMVRSNSWDDVLVRTITAVKAATTHSEYMAAIEQMINSPGQVVTATTPTPNLEKALFLPVDYSWMTDATMLSPAAITGLETIRRNFRPFQSFYINASSVGTPQAANENAYPSMTAPNEQYRLLALFRHWNLIHYFFPYKDDIGRPWESALREMIPVFVNTPESMRDYGRALQQMSAQINDSHGFISNPNAVQVWGMGTLPMEVLHIEGKTVVSALNFTPTVLNAAGLLGLQVGDVIISINGEHIDSIRKRLTPLIPASNPSALNRDLNYYILYGDISSAPLTIQRGTQTLTFDAKRVSFSTRNGGIITPTLPSVWRIMDNNIGYVDMGRLQRADVATMMRDLANTQGIVFDVRNYPNGTMYDICAYLGTPTPFVKFTQPNPFYPGTFAEPSSRLVSAPFISQYNAGGTKRYTGKTVALMNATTQSHAEFTLMSFRAMGMPLVGSQTAGADGNVVTVTMPGNVTVYYTSLGVYYPDGKPTQRIGIVPDVQILPTLTGFQAGRDEVLQRGIQAILGTTSVTSSPTGTDELLPFVPNPCQNETTLTLKSSQSGTVKIQLINMLGATVLTQDAALQIGLNTLSLNTATLASGSYHCRALLPNGQTVTLRLLAVVR
jgi:C-terminal processing protease CtpA/Prc